LVLELLGNIPGSTSRDFNPSLGEQGASGHHKSDVDNGVDGVEKSLLDGMGRRHVVCNTRNGSKLRRILERLSIR
jgi:hypothetical protein